MRSVKTFGTDLYTSNNLQLFLQVRSLTVVRSAENLSDSRVSSRITGIHMVEINLIDAIIVANSL